MLRNFFHIALLPIALILFFSCSKQKEENLPWTYSAVPQKIPLYDISFVNDSLGYCCGGITGEGYVFKTIDAGKNWFLSNKVDRRKLFGIHFLDEQNGWIAGDTLYMGYTHNGGKNWHFYWLADNVPTHGFNRPRLSNFNFLNDSIGFVCGGENYNKGIVYRTRDAGKNWEFIFYENEMNAVYSTNPETVYLAGYGLMLKSQNGGKSYSVLDFNQEYFRGLAFWDESGFAATYSGKIFQTTDGGKNWETAFTAPFEINDMDNNKEFIVLTGRNGGFAYSPYPGNNWTIAKNMPDVNFKAVSIVGNIAYAASKEGEVYRLALE